MTTHILLTGAGFSRNWGGWLASEAFEYLLGCTEIDEETRRLLWESGGGFEDTLADLANAKMMKGEGALTLLPMPWSGCSTPWDRASCSGSRSNSIGHQELPQ